MKEVICYKLDNGSLFEDKETALLAEQKLNNKKVLDHTQSVPLKFKVESIVFIAARNKIRQCVVKSIENEQAYYDEDIDELYTSVILDDLNDREDSYFAFSTTEFSRDLNKEITIKFIDLCNFNYEEYL
jgi:hypothetical protein